LSAGLLVPWVLDRSAGSAPDAAGPGGLLGWQLGWVALAALAAVATAVAAVALRSTTDPAPPSAEHRRWDRGRIGWLSGGYTFFGLGYIAYLTFVVAFLQEQGVGLRTVAAFWVVVGLAASVAGWTDPAWDAVEHRSALISGRSRA